MSYLVLKVLQNDLCSGVDIGCSLLGFSYQFKYLQSTFVYTVPCTIAHFSCDNGPPLERASLCAMGRLRSICTSWAQAAMKRGENMV